VEGGIGPLELVGSWAGYRVSKKKSEIVKDSERKTRLPMLVVINKDLVKLRYPILQITTFLRNLLIDLYSLLEILQAFPSGK
jgi:hypothetical protein